MKYERNTLPTDLALKDLDPKLFPNEELF